MGPYPVSVSIMDPQTRKVLIFDSIIECAAFFGVYKQTIHQLLKYRKINTPWKGYLIKRTRDQTPWPKEDEIIKTSRSFKQGIVVTITNIESGKSEKHSSAKSVAEALKCHVNIIYQRLRERSELPINGYIIKYK